MGEKYVVPATLCAASVHWRGYALLQENMMEKNKTSSYNYSSYVGV
jgi:hypothetical protein